MVEFGILKQSSLPAPGETRVLKLVGQNSYLYARHTGLFEPAVEIGDDVQQGQVAGWIHHPESPWEAAEEVTFSIDATILCKRIPGRVEPGDCLFQLGQDEALDK